MVKNEAFNKKGRHLDRSMAERRDLLCASLYLYNSNNIIQFQEDISEKA